MGSIGVASLVRGRGRGLGCGLFPQARCNNCEEVGVPSKRHEVGLKKEWGLSFWFKG
jgi:hypothetical protein